MEEKESKNLIFGNNFSKFLERNNISDRNIAYNMRVGISTISKWKKGYRPSEKNIKKLCCFLSMSRKELTGYEVGWV